MLSVICDESRCCRLFVSQSDVRVPDFPGNEAKGSHVVAFTRTIFIEQSDFREVREKTYKIKYFHRFNRISLCSF